jgi:hypothetical protein
MRRRYAATGALALAATAVAIGAGTSAARAPASKPLITSMNGAVEVPKGDLDGAGAASVVFVSPTKLCYTLNVMGIDKPVAAHIHKGAAGVAGDVVVAFTKLPATGNGGTAGACVTAQASVITAIKANPKGFYVNVHTAKFPGGALRGQLHA